MVGALSLSRAKLSGVKDFASIRFTRRVGLQRHRDQGDPWSQPRVSLRGDDEHARRRREDPLSGELRRVGRS